MSLEIFTPENLPADPGAVEQMHTCMEAGDAQAGVLCADHHLGYSMPIGGAIAYRDYLSPSGVGYDIGCGNKAVATSLLYQDIRTDLSGIMDRVAREVAFGMGRINDKPVEHDVLDEINTHEDKNVRSLGSLARKQLGTVGSGNHYVDLFREVGTDRVWIGVHFGSRGFGHKIASGFMSLATGGDFDGRPADGEMNSPPILLHTDSALGYLYQNAMETAGRYAYAGRDVVVNQVLDILGAEQFGEEVHNHHNFAWLEEHAEEAVWVVRKGSTPLWPGQKGFVGATMGENSVIIEGTIDYQPLSVMFGDKALWSAPHGAGRLMSRTEAKGKVNRKTGEVKKAGKIDWVSTRQGLVARGIEIRGGDADEAPAAYKRLPDVLAAHSTYVKVLHELQPIGVAMAGPDIKDFYKD